MSGAPAEASKDPQGWVCFILVWCPTQQRVPAPASPLQRRQSLPRAHCHVCLSPITDTHIQTSLLMLISPLCCDRSLQSFCAFYPFFQASSPESLSPSLWLNIMRSLCDAGLCPKETLCRSLQTHFLSLFL